MNNRKIKTPEYITDDTIACGIICKIHGSFDCRVGDHLNGKGCPTCDDLNFKEVKSYLNKLGIEVEKSQYDQPIINGNDLMEYFKKHN